MANHESFRGLVLGEKMKAADLREQCCRLRSGGRATRGSRRPWPDGSARGCSAAGLRRRSCG